MTSPSTDAPTQPDLRFWFDPVCPFAWMTSKWVRMVAAEREYTVEWKLISLRLLNSHIDYDSQFPTEYEAGHTAGLHMLRVAAAVREQLGGEALDRLQMAFGGEIFDVEQPDNSAAHRADYGSPAMVARVLARADLPPEMIDALGEESWDPVIQAETDEALALTGKDVGTPVLHFQPPEGVAFFGPVISRLPSPDQAVELWDHVIGLASFPGFAEMKRSLRERPQLRVLGLDDGSTGKVEDWHGGSRRPKK